MATLVFCLVTLCVQSLLLPAVRSQVHERYILAGGPKSYLFSHCVDDAKSINGVLYSIEVSTDVEFVHYVPKEVIEFEWTELDLGSEPNTIACAQEAFKIGVYMFKFDGSCKVSFHSSYDSTLEQGCGSEASEAVYLRPGPFNVMDGHIVPYGEFYGCYYSKPAGMAYDLEGNLVSEVVLPSTATCCPTADKGYCLIRDKGVGRLTYCEAQARCEAYGIPMASKSFYDNLASGEIDPNHPLGETFAWVNIRKINGKLLWMPEEVEVSASDVHRSPLSDYDCGNLEISHAKNKLTILEEPCYSNTDLVFCHDPDSTLPQCPLELTGN